MTPRTRRVAPGLAVAAAVAVLAAGCGSNDSSSKASDSKTTEKTTAKAPSAGATGTKLSLAADPGGKIAFDQTALKAKAGTNTIEFTNASQVPHAVEVEGNGVEEKTKTFQGGKASLKVELKPGKYEFYCPVDDHRGEGMKGVLTVK